MQQEGGWIKCLGNGNWEFATWFRHIIRRTASMHPAMSRLHQATVETTGLSHEGQPHVLYPSLLATALTETPLIPTRNAVITQSAHSSKLAWNSARVKYTPRTGITTAAKLN